MKRILVIAAMLALPLLVMAQNTKKVAILETVDKEGNVPYGVRLQLRSSLTYAISSTSGYEGYDRVDMSSIMGEHNFQRTGMVSDAQIKKLGEMTGAGSILVAEAAVYDASHIIITAKIVSVETAGVEAAAPPKVSSTDPESMEKACIELAKRLLGKSGGSSSSASNNAPAGYTDLGLSSGTNWKNLNANGFYTYEEAISQFGERLPSLEQWGELMDECQWSWTGSGYKVTGPNGNSIFLPAAGFVYSGMNSDVGSYWSSTLSNNDDFRWSFFFNSSRMFPQRAYIIDGYSGKRSVRLVQD